MSKPHFLLCFLGFSIFFSCSYVYASTSSNPLQLQTLNTKPEHINPKLPPEPSPHPTNSRGLPTWSSSATTWAQSSLRPPSTFTSSGMVVGLLPKSSSSRTSSIPSLPPLLLLSPPSPNGGALFLFTQIKLAPMSPVLSSSLANTPIGLLSWGPLDSSFHPASDCHSREICSFPGGSQEWDLSDPHCARRDRTGLLSSCCGFHYFTFPSMVGYTLPYAWVGNSGKQCPDVCAYPFAIPGYMGGGGPGALKAPNGDVGVDGMISVIGHELAELSSNPLVNAWYAGEDPTAPTEIGDLCEGLYGTGGGGGYIGQVMRDKQGRTFNMYGGRGRKFLVQWIWSPELKACAGPNAMD
ncbi:hypothetical protein GH714_041507 [Hevea brasiliensis]|uniref:Uncharacterized protein n=1 Tax=Hevea brasiliensis TaxID=3981 RepID=A0A6A6MV47_HEVBR|nr:hypothetical protein GH714_041507 [Hevea brasiliensis]